MRIALAQVSSSTDPEANLALVAEQVDAAAAAGARLVVLPEATMASFATRSADIAEPLDGAFAREVRRLASEHGVAVAVGMFTPARAGDGGPSRCRNTVLVAGEGVEASYDKIHLFDALGFTESRHVEAGSKPRLFDLDGVRFGLAICYDIRFPELFKHYADAGAHAVIVPTSWQGGEGKAEQFRTLAIARAMDSTAYVLACGQAEPAASGDTKAPLGVGHSIAVDPLGGVLVEAGGGPELLVVDLDPERVESARERMPVLANSRFGLIRPGEAVFL